MAYSTPSVTTSSAAFTQLQAGGLSGVLELLVTANKTARSNPVTAATVSAAGVSNAGGSLAAGGYIFNFTESNGVGETAVSTDSAAMTVATAGIPLITFPALQTGNTSRNAYLSAANGATGTKVLYATGVTTITMALSAAAPTNSFAAAPPTVNTTGYTYTDTNGNVHNEVIDFVRAFKSNNGQKAYTALRKVVEDYLRGDPTPYRASMMRFRQAATTFHLMAKACDDIGTLMDSNAGSLTTAATGTGGRIGIRTFP